MIVRHTMTTPDDLEDELHQLQRQLDGEDVRDAARALLDPGETLREFGDIGVAFGDDGPVSEWQPLDLKPSRWFDKAWTFGTKTTIRKIFFSFLLAPLVVYAAVESLGDVLTSGPSTLLERLVGGRTCQGPRDSLARRMQHALSALGPNADRFALSDRRLLLVRGTVFTDPPDLTVVSSVPLAKIAQARHRPRGPLRRRVEIRFTDDSRIVLALPTFRSPKPQQFLAALEPGSRPLAG
jgi:hypothetical protein